MKADQFISLYENALASQDWEYVEPLMSDQVCVTFSNGKVHKGKDKVKAAFEANFSSIKSEKYKMKDIVWLKNQSNYAVYIFKFEWQGLIDNQSVSGSGLGTTVIIKENDTWKLLTEHLGKGA